MRFQNSWARNRLRDDVRARVEFALHMVASKAYGDRHEVSPPARAAMRRVVAQILQEAERFYGFARDVDLSAPPAAGNTCGLTFELAQEALRHFPDWALAEVLARLTVAQRV